MSSYQLLEIRSGRVDVGPDGVDVRAIDSADHQVRSIVEDHPDISEVRVRRILRSNACSEGRRNRLETRCAVRRGRRRKVGIGRHRVENAKVQIVQRGLRSGYASKPASSVDGCVCRCDFLPHACDDALHIGERLPGILAGRNACLEIGLDSLQICDDASHASKTLAAFFDGILPQAAFQETCRIVEECSRVCECRGSIRCRHVLFLY